MKRSESIPILTEDVKVVPMTTDVELFSMEREWNSLLQESRADTVFLTWEWLTAWWRAYGTGLELYILRVEKDGRTIGLIPFYRKTVSRFGVFSFRALALLGDGSADSDYLDWISQSGDEEMVTRAVADFLLHNRGEWDLILLNEIPETSPHLPLLRRLCSQKGWYWEEEEVPCVFVDLPAEWERYLRSLKPRMRTKVRSLMRRLEQDFTVRFEHCERADDLRPLLESFFDLHNHRWQREGRGGVFASPAKVQFYQEMSHLFLSRGWLRLYSLAVDNRYVAHQFCFEYQSTIFLLQEGFDPEWAEYGVGNVLRAYVFRHCIERKVRVYDFLGGVTPHKLSWGAVVKKSVRASVGPPTMRNRLFFELSKGIEWGKRRLKTILPEAVVASVQALKRGGLFRRDGRPTGAQ